MLNLLFSESPTRIIHNKTNWRFDWVRIKGESESDLDAVAT